MTVEFLAKKNYLRTQTSTINYFTVLPVQLTERGLESWHGFGHTNFPPVFNLTYPIFLHDR